MITNTNDQCNLEMYYGGKVVTFKTVDGCNAWGCVRCWGTIVYLRSLSVKDALKRNGKERQFYKKLKRFAVRMAKFEYQLLCAYENGYTKQSQIIKRIRKRQHQSAAHYLQPPKSWRQKPRQKKFRFHSKTA